MTKTIDEYMKRDGAAPLWIVGNALSVLREFPENCVDCCITSPPYWKKRQYANGGIGMEADYRDYIRNLTDIFAEIRRILKPSGSFWLNIGDSYHKKSLLNIPWRVSIALTEQGWILRNTVIWNKVKGGMDNTTDRLRNVYEPLFHFVKREMVF
ncbi:MAG: site-specific DNA-methyltransferase [Oscillospiraceae bacterium]|nr:site-specific DNA-methyltransferase [Oscillospiraceae bacterium]